jgi:hypothetical protein
MVQAILEAVVVKVMTCTKSVNVVYEFLQKVKNWEAGGILKSVTRSGNNSWTGDTPVGKTHIYCEPNKNCSILDHVLVAGNIKWDVYLRIISNGMGVGKKR